MSQAGWRCDCGAMMRMSRTRCPVCRAEHVFDPLESLLRPARAGEESKFCVNRPHSKLGCNWLRYAREEGMCYACELTATTPVLDIKNNRAAFRRFEEPKRRLVGALGRMRLLPLYEHAEGVHLRFHLLQDRSDNPIIADEVVMTGHLRGDITVNMRETDRIHIETTRKAFNEKYRTTLGTLRHEVGHYFFLVLVAPAAKRLAKFRELFGDESRDYAAAMEEYHRLKKHRRKKKKEYISAYAQSHPDEDWAETWAHFMHMEDALAVWSIIGDRPFKNNTDASNFDYTIENWNKLARMANAINLSLGHEPVYPFQLNDKVIEKMRFVAETIEGAGGKPYQYLTY